LGGKKKSGARVLFFSGKSRDGESHARKKGVTTGERGQRKKGEGRVLQVSGGGPSMEKREKVRGVEDAGRCG